ncbi:MAG: hypothetical protein OXR66_09460 [Candidatus Woesearchaeota archaeon]|nr:hypothetical protein [Candidatus Woesearchaeota archaeon]
MKSQGAWKFFVAVGLFVLLMGGVYWWQGHTETKERLDNQYNGFDFTYSGLYWTTEIIMRDQPILMTFRYHPRDALNVWKARTVVDPILKENPRKIWISLPPDADPKVVLAGVEIARITGERHNMLNIPTSSAFSAPLEGFDTPVKTCDDATPEEVVLVFVPHEENTIVRDGSCVILTYKNDDDSILVADRYAYMLLQIMN